MLAVETTDDRDMVGIDLLSLSELEDELATLAGHISAGMCRWLELVGDTVSSAP